WFVRPGTIATKVLGRLAGGQLLEEIMTFLILFLDLREGFAQRAASTRALLRDSKTAFALVASPGPNHLHDAGNLVRGLAERNVSLDVVVMNQSFIPEPADPMVPVQARPGPRPVPAGYESLVEKLDAIRASAVRDNEAAERGIEEFVSRERLRGAPILRLAKMSEPVHRLTGLDHLAQRLMEAGEGATGAGVGSL
ncbi:MAG: hypothetical protein KC416_07315, partial [Myxococcales bacterium]|nr:hypothetical protein [Myxococcales bacterium]